MKLLNFIKITTIAVITTVMLLSNTTNSHAQKQADFEPLTWGVKAGLTISDMWGDDVGATSTRAGFTGGAFLNYRFSQYVSVQPEALFTMKYSEVRDGVLGENLKTEYDFGYLEIPVLLKAHITTGGIVSPNLYAGPSLAFKLYGDANGSDLDSDLRSADFGFAFGGGLDIGQRVNIDARYTLGVVDVFDVPADPEAKTGLFAMTLGIGF